MNAAVRAHRILIALANFQKAEDANNWLAKLAGERLGKLIGCYRNPVPEDDVIGIFTNGLVWLDNNLEITIPFAEIIEVTLPTGKESEGLLLKARDGRQLLLPIRGQRGQFFDSMEVLRFLDRVIGDLRE